MRIQYLHELFEKHPEKEILAFEGPCHVCKEKTCVEIGKTKENSFQIAGGAVYQTHNPTNEEETFRVKCPRCFELDNILRNYQECEVYSRVVGYLRPISQYNPGKKQEFNDRENFDIEKEEVHGRYNQANSWYV